MMMADDRHDAEALRQVCEFYGLDPNALTTEERHQLQNSFFYAETKLSIAVSEFRQAVILVAREAAQDWETRARKFCATIASALRRGGG